MRCRVLQRWLRRRHGTNRLAEPCCERAVEVELHRHDYDCCERCRENEKLCVLVCGVK